MPTAATLHAQRMQLFKQIAGGLKTRAIHTVPGENDAALDGGVSTASISARATTHSITRASISSRSIMCRGAAPRLARRNWPGSRQDLARFPKTAPIIVFTHRPLFDLKPEWEWFTRDGDAVMNTLAPYENVTVLYGHIHRHDVHQTGKVKHFAARSLIFAFNDPATNENKKPLPFDQNDPFKDLGIRLVCVQGTREQGRGPWRQRHRSYQGRVLRPFGNAADDQGQQINRWGFIQ